jgi:hypothetical protein
VRVVREEAELSERRACGLIGMHRGSWRYQRRERNEGALRARLRQLAAERPRFGYRRLYIFLRREKSEDGTLRWPVNPRRSRNERGLRRARQDRRSCAGVPRDTDIMELLQGSGITTGEPSLAEKVVYS